MKKSLIGLLSLSLLCSACGTSQQASGQAGVIFTGASLGGSLGSAIGGLIGDRHGWHGAYRGSAIGSIVGTVAGAAIGHAATTSRQKSRAYPEELPPPAHVETRYSPLDDLRIQHIQFIDDDRNQVLQSREQARIIFEVIQTGRRTAYRVVPVVTEVSGQKRIQLSPPVLVESIAPDEGIRYTATVYTGKKLKPGEAVFRLSVTDEYGQEYDWQEFIVPTER